MKIKTQKNELIPLDKGSMKSIMGGGDYYVIINGQLILIVNKRE